MEQEVLPKHDKAALFVLLLLSLKIEWKTTGGIMEIGSPVKAAYAGKILWFLNLHENIDVVCLCQAAALIPTSITTHPGFSHSPPWI